MTVRRVRVGDVLQMERERIQPEITAEYRQIGVYSWGKGIIENDPVSGADLSKVSYFRFPVGALILSNIQAWEAAIAVSEPRHSEFIASQRFLPYVPRRSAEVDVRYLCHFFLSEPGMQLIRKASPGTVTRNRTLGIAAFEDLTIPLPTLDEQRAIADRLDQFLALSRATTRDEFSNADRITAIREHALSAVDDGEHVEIGTLLRESTDSVRVSTTDVYPDAGILNRGRGLFRKPDRLGAETKYRSLFPIRSEQLVYSKLFAWEGSIAVVPEEFDGCYVSSEFPHFDIDSSRVSTQYLACAVRAADFMNQLSAAGSGMGQRRQRVNVDTFLSLKVWLPGRNTQRKVVAIWDRADRVEALYGVRARLTTAIPQAARNEVFASLV